MKKAKTIFALILIAILPFLFTCGGGGGGDGNGGGGDTTAPSAPTNLTATTASSSQIDLSWTASTDNVGVAGYNIYRGGIYLKSVTTTSTSDTNLNPSTQYCYIVSAYDAAGNESAQSNQACAITLTGDANITPDVSGVWEGTWTSTQEPEISGNWCTEFNQSNGNLSGKLYINGTLVGEDLKGLVSNSNIQFGSLTGGNIQFIGTLINNATGASGTYTRQTPPDQGNWSGQKTTKPSCITGGGVLYLYTGYYEEDPGANPEDPTTGDLYVCLPYTDGLFKGQFLFSYLGCYGGVDIGDIEGNKSGASIQGNWAGNVDGFSIGGGFIGSYTVAEGAYTGQWTNDSGKLFISKNMQGYACIHGPSCSIENPCWNVCCYYVAPYGTWKLYGPGGKDFDVNIQLGDTISFSWGPVTGASSYLISVYDKNCMCSEFSFEECLKWQALTERTSLKYGEPTTISNGCVQEIANPESLQHDKKYVVTVKAVEGGVGCNIGLLGKTVGFFSGSFQP